MLILTRLVNESIVINGNVRIEILGVDRGRVKIGIDAPRDVKIVREELVEKHPRILGLLKEKVK